MTLIELINQINTKHTLKIIGCQQAVNHGSCNWDCCFYSNSYCLMLPGEFEAAISLGYRVDGYEIIDDNYFGGKKVVPASKKCCVGPEMPENHYKTLDCWFYPVWPIVKDEAIRMIVGDLCPLRSASLDTVKAHARTIEKYVKILALMPEVRTFLSKAEMIGYNDLEYKL
jgi:hypothetical protein